MKKYTMEDCHELLMLDESLNVLDLQCRASGVKWIRTFCLWSDIGMVLY